MRTWNGREGIPEMRLLEDPVCQSPQGTAPSNRLRQVEEAPRTLQGLRKGLWDSAFSPGTAVNLPDAMQRAPPSLVLGLQADPLYPPTHPAKEVQDCWLMVCPEPRRVRTALAFLLPVSALPVSNQHF